MLNKDYKILFVTIIFFWFAQYVYIPYQTPYLNQIGTSSSMVGAIIGAYGISQMILRLPIGVSADCTNRHKLLIIIGCMSSGIASLFRIIWCNAMGFFVANLFSGLASAMWISFMVLYTSYFTSQSQQKATSQVILANNIGMLLGFITSTLLYQMIGMQMICVLSLISGFIAATIAFRLTDQIVTNDQPRPKIRQLLKICKNKKLILFSSLAMIQQGIQMATAMSFTNQIIQSLNSSTIMVGFSSIIYMLSAVMSSKLSSSDKFDKQHAYRYISLIFIATAIYCFLIPNQKSVWLIFLLQILPGLSTGILFSLLNVEAMSQIPTDKKSTAMGFFQSIYALGMTVFPYLSGLILVVYNIKVAYYFLAIVCIIAAIVMQVYKFIMNTNINVDYQTSISNM